MAETEFPEPDQAPGAPHPRMADRVFGHAGAESQVLDAVGQGRVHHAWLISGARGVGKATLAWRLARFLLSEPEPQGGGLFGAPPPPVSLDVAPDHPVARRLRALSEPRFHLLRRTPNEKRTQLSTVITVDDVRRMRSFFALSAADGGRRVALIDAVDEMNASSANALLKLLEEPPPGAVFLLVAHRPALLLPTIRSRCRALRLAPLGARDLSQALVQAGGDGVGAAALAELAGGSVGAAVALTAGDGLALYGDLAGLFRGQMDRARAIAFCDGASQRGAGDRFDLVLSLVDLMLARLSRAAATGAPPPEAAPGEAGLFSRLAASPLAARPWADLAQSLTLRARRGRAVNLDPAALLLDMLVRIDETAGLLANG